MPIFCTNGDKPKIRYTINGQQGVYESKIAPVEVDVKPFGKCWKLTYFNATPFNDSGRRIIANGISGNKWVRGSFISKVDATVPAPSYYVGCIASFLIIDGVKTSEWAVDWTWEEENNQNFCPALDPTKTNDCQIQIKDPSNGTILLTDRGKCPITFDVACAGNCPPGSIECKIPEYPGYCCIPCSEIRNGINAATAAIRGINA